VLNTSAINTITKSSTKPWSSTTANCHLCGSGERNQEQRKTKVSFCRTMIQALELQRLAKRHILGWSDIEQRRNQAHSLSGYWVTLVWRHQIVSQSVQSVGWSVSQSVEKMQRFRVDLKTFLGLAMPNQYCHAITKLILDWFVGGIFR